jgi:hypothetical protein
LPGFVQRRGEVASGDRDTSGTMAPRAPKPAIPKQFQAASA